MESVMRMLYYYDKLDYKHYCKHLMTLCHELNDALYFGDFKAYQTQEVIMKGDEVIKYEFTYQIKFMRDYSAENRLLEKVCIDLIQGQTGCIDVIPKTDWILCKEYNVGDIHKEIVQREIDLENPDNVERQIEESKKLFRKYIKQKREERGMTEYDYDEI